MVNYHAHTTRCRHAEGSEREYVAAAIDAGFTTLGFSDHAPYLFPDGYVSSFRMLPEELRGYCDTILSLREEFRGRIEIRLGLEMEYYPDLFAAQMEFLKDYPLEYLILGQHALYNEIERVYSGRPTEDPALLRQYVDQVIEGLETGIFTYLAHPDIINFIGSPAEYERQMRRLFRASNRLGVPIELNQLGLTEGKQYPNPVFWRLAAEEGVTAILGVDAHCPGDLTDTAARAAALKFAADCGVRLAEDVPLRPVFGSDPNRCK